MMPVGSKWELYIPQDLAYGERAMGAKIPAYSTLIFTIEFVRNCGVIKLSTNYLNDAFILIVLYLMEKQSCSYIKYSVHPSNSLRMAEFKSNTYSQQSV